MLVPGIAAVAAFRLLLGVGAGGFWSLAATVGMRLAPAEKLGRAIAIIFSGGSVATVMGLPLIGALSNVADWHVALQTLAILLAVLLLVQGVLLPAMAPATSPSLASLASAFALRPLRQVLYATLFLVAGQFCAYTFFTASLQQRLSMTPMRVEMALWVFGTSCVAGPFVFARMTSAAPAGMLLRALLGMGVAAVGLRSETGSSIPAFVAITAWGMFWGAVPTTLQMWCLKSSGDAPELGSALFVSAFQASLGLGAAIGGQLVHRLGISWANSGSLVLWLAGAATLGCFATDRPGRAAQR